VNSQLDNLAKRGPAALSGMRVLYVEGVWDLRILELLYGNELREGQVLVSPMYGTFAASAVVTSVWQRMVGRPSL
jgi:hypothetical protein